MNLTSDALRRNTSALTHDGEQDLAAAYPGGLLDLALVRARVRRAQPRQVDGGVAVLGVGRVEVDATLHDRVVLEGPVAGIKDHLRIEGRESGWIKINNRLKRCIQVPMNQPDASH